MIIKGFIKEVGQTRGWTTKEGDERQSARLTVEIPYVAKDGQERQDELIAEMNVVNEGFLEGLRMAQQGHEKCEMQVGFHLSDWNGKKIQNIRVYGVTKLI